MPLVGLLLLGLLASGCTMFGGRGSYEVTAELARSYNLFAGSPVRVLGLDVGRITELEVSPDRDTVRVHMRIRGDVDLPEDAFLTVVPESVLGERYVQFDPPYTGGPRLPGGATIPLERTQVPFEFDEVLEGLNEFVEGLDGQELARLVDNLAEVLDGKGEQLGRTIDQAHEAVGVLRDNDEELVALVSRLADLNETLATRDRQIGRIIEDWNTLTRSLADDRVDLDRALSGLVDLTRETALLLETNRTHLEDSIATLTRVGRTLDRNLSNVSLSILGSAELFRHAERVVRHDRNMLPLHNQTFALPQVITDSFIWRLQGICLSAGLSEDECSFDLLAGLIDGVICAPPFVVCQPGSVTLEEALQRIISADTPASAAIFEVLRDRAAGTPAAQPEQAPAEPEDDEEPRSRGGNLLDDLGGALQGGVLR